LDWLRDQIDPFFEARASAFLKDPWAARDAYIAVILDPSPERLDAFFGAHQRAPLDPAARAETRRLLEMQRHRLLMYTSCGWFFDEISALEPVQILRYAAIALQYLGDLGGGRLEPEFVRRLEAAPSNIPALRDGGEVYRQLIRPTEVDLRRVIAHYAITGLVDEHPADARIYAYRVTCLDESRQASDGTALRIAHVRVSALATGETREMMYALVHYGGHDFSCGIRAWEDQATYDAMKADLLRRYGELSVADMVRGMDEYFPGEPLTLAHLFLEERRHVLDSVIRAALDKPEETYRHIWEENRKLVHYLLQVDVPVPEALRLVGRHVLEQQACDALERMAELAAIPERVFEIAAEAKALDLTLDLTRPRAAARRAVERALDAVAEAPTAPHVAAATALIESANRLGLHYGHWAAQNRFFELWGAHPEARTTLRPLAAALGFELPA